MVELVLLLPGRMAGVFLDREKEKAILAENQDLSAKDRFFALFLDQQGEKGTCTLKTRVLDT